MNTQPPRLRVLRFRPAPPQDNQAAELVRLFQTLDSEHRELLLWWAQRFSDATSEPATTLTTKAQRLAIEHPGAALVVEKLIDRYQPRGDA